MKRLIAQYPIISFVIFAYGFLWLGALGMLSEVIPKFGEWPLFYAGREVVKIRLWRTVLLWSPNFAAMTIVFILAGSQGVRDLLKKFLIWRVGIKWWFVAFGVPAVLALVSAGIYGWIGKPLSFVFLEFLPGIFLIHILYSFSASGFGEEAGWRGFALPRLQSRYGAISASVLVGLIWCFWHMPVWLVQQVDFWYIVHFLILMIGLSIVYTWIYNNAKGSLLLIAVIHNTGNAIDATLSTSFAAVISNQSIGDAFNVVLLVFCLSLIFLTQGTLGFREEK